MSSGLEVRESTLNSSWVGKRLWINLVSLGFESLHAGGAIKATEGSDKDAKNTQYASMWLQHIALLDDMQSEHPGVKVRNIDGLAGVDYLSPGALTSFVSYVFGPVINALQDAGYEGGKNLDAAPYDWRLAPKAMEERDQYFTRTMKQVERMYETNNSTPVVLLCHSLGCKVGHYFLNFAKRQQGQAWLNKYIHTYMPVGAPHLGAPTAVRSPVSGEKMGLEAFLTNEEALIFGRSLGSGPWLFPSLLPPSATTSAIVKKQGMLTIESLGDIDVFPLVGGRDVCDRPKKVKLMITFGGETIATDFVNIDESGRVTFTHKFVFATKADQPTGADGENKLIVVLGEPGIAAARKAQPDPNENDFSCCLCCCKCLVCYCIWGPILESLGQGLADAALTTADTIAKVSGGSSALGFSDEINFDGKQGSTEMDVPLFRSKSSQVTTNCRIKATWNPWKDQPNQFAQVARSVSAISEKHHAAPVLTATNPNGDAYTEMSGLELMYRESLVNTPPFVSSVYDSDPFQPRAMSSTDAPPVQRVKAIYGINVPTEVGAIYNLHNSMIENPQGIKNYYTLDTTATLGPEGGYICKNGIIWETKETSYEIKSADGGVMNVNCSGDGTVPYWSLQHAREWIGQCDVTVDEIEGANHREILADERFHAVVLDYITK
jgi:hypothetical protein